MTTYIDEDEYLAHYGVLRQSGRYPWGSGKTQNQRNRMFLDDIKEMEDAGMTQVEVARGLGISTTELRAAKSIARNQVKAENIAMVQKLKDKGWSNPAIAERVFGDRAKESKVRLYLAPGAADKSDALQTTASVLRRHVDEKTYIDIGVGVEAYLGVSKDRLATAVAMLKEEGYEVHTFKEKQLGTGEFTQFKVLTPPGTTKRDAFMNRENLQQVFEWSEDNGRSFNRIHPPLGIDPRRVKVRYAKDGGAKEDGVIYVRPGVDDISLGGNSYAQVRIKVGDTHYLKGMAFYKDDLPDGVDLVFNANKDDTGNPFDAMKPLKDDPNMPFGAQIRRQILTGKGTKDERPSSAMNLVNEQGDWGGWARTLSSQVLSKQQPELVKRQLDEAFDDRKSELDGIMALTNPTVKRKLLESFADSTDSAAVHLKAAALPRQNWHAILPIPSLKDNEVFAPNYKDGEEVVLVRYPHGGKFEIPTLRVNNRNREARKAIGVDAQDAIGINHKVAERLSGADFDGDTVLVIPNRRKDIKTEPALERLKGFDPVREYPAYEGMPKLNPTHKQKMMGDVTNLINDMTILGASHEELARAVRHSMVVIDAEKKHLDYRRSERDHGIRKLKEQYQGRSNAGAATLISRKKSWEFRPERRLKRVSEGGPVNPVTGRKQYTEKGSTRTLSDGTVVPRMEKVKKLDLVDDAHDLVSEHRTPVERHYADYSNDLRRLAGKARLESIRTPRLETQASAKKTYAAEVANLHNYLLLADRNRPLERQAQVIGNAEARAKKRANPELDKDQRRKVEYEALANARHRTGAAKLKISFTDKEWEAIQHGAISDTALRKLLDVADPVRVKELATPRERKLMTPSKTTRAKQMLARGFTRAEVAEHLGVSLSTLDVGIKEGGE